MQSADTFPPSLTSEAAFLLISQHLQICYQAYLLHEVLVLKAETGARKDEMHGQFRSYGTRGCRKKQFSRRAGFLFWGFVAFFCLLRSDIVLRCISSLFHNSGNFLLGLHRNQSQKKEEIMGLVKLGAIKQT